MKTISGKTIDRTWKRINEATEEEAQRLLDAMAKQQPFLVAYLLAVEETLMGDQERGQLTLIGLILWEIISGETPGLRQITMDDLEAAEEELAARLGGGDGGGGHELGHLTHGVGAQLLVAQVLAHAVAGATWRTHQA